jgi:carbon monoxide dehydrogenase subunit G
MEHEVLVQLPAAAVRRVLREPGAVARCLPGFAEDASAGAAGQTSAGRLKLRIGGSSITYRGELRLRPEPDGGVLAEVDAVQSVGEGSVTGTVRAGILPGEGASSRVVFQLALSAKGRAADLPQDAVQAAGRRLLDRFCAALPTDPHALVVAQGVEPPVESLPVAEEKPSGEAAEGEADEGPEPATPGGPSRDDAAAGPADAEGSAEGASGRTASDEAPPDAAVPDQASTDPTTPAEAPAEAATPDSTSAQDSDQAASDAEPADDVDAEEPADDDADLDALAVGAVLPSELGADRDDFEDGLDDDADAWPESAPPRRSLLGPSAEEVDHAPPRGRYAPALPARSARSRAAARWGGDRRLGEPPQGPMSALGADRATWLVGGTALLGAAALLARRLRRR